MASQVDNQSDVEVRFDLQPSQPYPSTPPLASICTSQLEVFAEAAAVPPDAPRKQRPIYGGKTLPMPRPMDLSDEEEPEQDTGVTVWDAVGEDAALGGTPNVPYYLQMYGYDDEEIVKTLRGIATGIYASRIAPAKRHMKKMKKDDN